ncbi:MAG TPA: ATP-binding protein [Gaiellaceae bacterium]|nr:ATP-binding protein [Gaiellaceae bacterium]
MRLLAKLVALLVCEGALLALALLVGEPYLFGAATAVVALVVVARHTLAAADAERMAARFKSVFEASPIGISFGHGGYMTNTNRAFQELVGYTAEELAGLNYLELTHPDDVADDPGLVEHLPRAGEKLVFEKRYLRKDGGVRRARVHLTLSPDSGFGIGLVEDVTEQLRLEERLRESEKLEAVGKLAAGIAHDFNNLMTVVVGYSDAILRDPRRKLEWRVTEIRNAGERAAGLTRQLLAFSHRQYGRPELVDVGRLLRELEPLLARLVGDDVALSIAATPDACVVADHSQLGQVLMNLAVNARDAMPDGGTFELAVSAGQDEVVLTAADSGVGMAADVVGHIFEPFFTTKNRALSTGLGLATVYGVVSQGGGRVEVESEPGRGTTFRLSFPRAVAAVAA